MLWQDLTGRFARTQGTDSENRHRRVKDEPKHKDHPTWYYAHSRAVDKRSEIAGGQWMQIHF